MSDQHDSLSEDVLARSFCKANPELRYVAQWGCWMRWDGTRWVQDNTLFVFDRVRNHIRLSNPQNPSIWLTAKRVAAVERLAKADRAYATTPDLWDNNDLELNTQSGIVQLQSTRLLPSDPDRYCTLVTGAESPLGACPVWDQFIDQITGGDQEYASYLQRIIGYGATGLTHEHAFFFLLGTGANGKGTFLNTLGKVLGSYVKNAPMNTFTESRSEAHPTELAMLQGARMVIAQESNRGQYWAESRIKALTGGDPVTARKMRQNFFTYQPKFKIFFSGNHMPQLRSVDRAMQRRLKILPFLQVFRDTAADPGLTNRLWAERNGILRWIVEGAKKYLQIGLATPDLVESYTMDYLNSQDTFGLWISECCEIDPTFWDSPQNLYDSWCIFTSEYDEDPGSSKTLGDRLSKGGFKRGNSSSKGGRYWIGLRGRDQNR